MRVEEIEIEISIKLIGENIFFELDDGSRRRSGAAGSWNVFDLEEPQIRLQINKTVKR